MQIDVKTVAEGTGSAAAVAQLQDAIQASTFVVISGDLVTDVPLKVYIPTNPAISLFSVQPNSEAPLAFLGLVPNCLGLTLQALAASHYVTEATATALLKERRVPPALETKPGKAPKNTDYIGADLLPLCAVPTCSSLAASICLQSMLRPFGCPVQSVMMFVLRMSDSICYVLQLCMHRWSCCKETAAVHCCYGCVCTGVDATNKQLLFIAGSTPDARRQVKVPLAAMRDGRLSIRTDLMDAHLYIFHKQTFLKALQARPSYTSIRQVMIAAHPRLFHNLEATSNINTNTWQLTPTSTTIMVTCSTLA